MSSYATPEDLETFGLPVGALSGSPVDLQRALDAASSFADSYIGNKYTLPLKPFPGPPPFYDPALVACVCQIAAWNLMVRRGLNPDGTPEILRTGFQDARDWLVRVSKGQAVLQVLQSSPASLQPDLSSNQPRGYGDLIGNGASDYPGVGNAGWGV